MPSFRESKGFPKKKKKQDSLTKLKGKVWVQVSRYVRMRDADWKGYIRCCTCGAYKFWKDCDAGHFVPGRRSSILFDVRGIHAQCKRCNGPLKGNPRKYDLFMKKKYGQDVIDELDKLDTQDKQFTREELSGLLKLYTRKAKQLENKVSQISCL